MNNVKSALCGLIFTLSLAACGGDGGSDLDSPPASSQDTFSLSKLQSAAEGSVHSAQLTSTNSGGSTYTGIIGKKILSAVQNMKASSEGFAAEYSRAEFGSGWTDDDGDCQNTRHETLIAQSRTPVTFKSIKGCQVLEGSWESPYTNKLIFKSSKLDIDHVVPLKWAWERGASGWPKSKRKGFANDPLNLLAVEARLNRQKGAKGPDDWLPPENECRYLRLFETIKGTYGLTYSSREEVVAERLQLEHCG